jgi:hypothetical protein
VLTCAHQEKVEVLKGGFPRCGACGLCGCCRVVATRKLPTKIEQTHHESLLVCLRLQWHSSLPWHSRPARWRKPTHPFYALARRHTHSSRLRTCVPQAEGRYRSRLRIGWGISNSPNPWKQGSAKLAVRKLEFTQAELDQVVFEPAEPKSAASRRLNLFDEL